MGGLNVNLCIVDRHSAFYKALPEISDKMGIVQNMDWTGLDNWHGLDWTVGLDWTDFFLFL